MAYITKYCRHLEIRKRKIFRAEIEGIKAEWFPIKGSLRGGNSWWMQWGDPAGLGWRWAAWLFETTWLWRNTFERNVKKWLVMWFHLWSWESSSFPFWSFLFHWLHQREKEMPVGFWSPDISAWDCLQKKRLWGQQPSQITSGQEHTCPTHCGYLKVLEWMYWSSRAPRWRFWIWQGCNLTSRKYRVGEEKSWVWRGCGAFPQKGRIKALASWSWLRAALQHTSKRGPWWKTWWLTLRESVRGTNCDLSL